MNNKLFIILIWIALLCQALPTAAQYNWVTTPIPNAGSRYDDMAWRTPDLGYAIDYAGVLRKTTDGAQTWQPLTGPAGSAYRSIAFLTDQKGFIGKLMSGGDPYTLYRTLDAGQTWAPVPIPGVPSAQQGFCGMSVVNEQVMFACGRYSGPAYFYKTTDGGTTWSSQNMSPHAAGLIDCYFWSPDSGIVVGHNGNPWNTGNSVILFTADGGQTWQNRYTSTRTSELCWKITFPSANVGYVSVYSEGAGPIMVLKTVDKGQTWQELTVAPGPYYAEGIGFLNEQIGWLGGGISNQVYHTTDGGQTWTQQPVGSLLNRFHFFGDSLAYASGQKVYKLDLRILSAPGQLAQQTQNQLSAPVPNPAAGRVLFTLDMPAPGPAKLVLVNATGRPVRQLYQTALQQAGKQKLNIPLDGLAPGLYLVQLQTGQGVQSQKLVIGQ